MLDPRRGAERFGMISFFSPTHSASGPLFHGLSFRAAVTKRRLQRNNRHWLEIFFPEGWLCHRDGWNRSTRWRYLSERIRSLLSRHEAGDRDPWGVPLSTAHLGFALSVFSKRLLHDAPRLGASFTQAEEAKEGMLDIRRDAGYRMGIPETILSQDGPEAARIHQMAKRCERHPSGQDDISASLTMLRNMRISVRHKLGQRGHLKLGPVVTLGGR